jgi:hypothetical protein
VLIVDVKRLHLVLAVDAGHPCSLAIQPEHFDCCDLQLSGTCQVLPGSQRGNHARADYG